ncbi:alkyl hydroperoxide reductase/ Thiol specific antioxidant/ Mal allergen [endosymbiont of Acanthamoeba sp. UWC8]|uniref:peroxiredoxin n=1 Tax=endosymbiont of Acanthamoeba sp. UWC8 TaxID=86106 RepID=UPI0004D1ED35|nr:peroxiredoxin [endosymbiont of Acanthamoeba sp. UWC8]AIF81629.1 alkyl hydroperoxide reductase/ Thiol specific antioxidant/ Mal allergen [endosymbiont of Acanthamoeba sp. UWC8]
MAVLVRKEAPNFTAQAVFPDNSIKELNLKEYLKGKYGVIFFYPLDFTFVCPSEILAFSSKSEEFEKRDAKVIGISIDSQFTHLAYRNTPTDKGGIGQVTFPLVSDLTHKIAADYDVLSDAGVALRGTFLIDKQGIVRHQIINDLPLGRNIEEAIRMVDALQYSEKHGEVCPANWKQGKEAMKPTQEGVAAYLKTNAGKI